MTIPAELLPLVTTLQGAIILGLVAWIWRTDRRVLKMEVEHGATQKQLESLKAEVVSVRADSTYTRVRIDEIRQDVHAILTATGGNP